MAKPLALVLLCLVQAVVVLDATIVAVALPAIRADLHLSPAGLQWVVTAHALTFGGFLLVAGRAADLLGARRLFRAGLAVFTGASLACGLARSPGVLVAARAVQGLGAAAASPAALAPLGRTFADGRERTK